MPCETRGQTTVPLSDPFFFFGDLKLLIVVPPHSLMMTSENKHICKKIHHFKSTYIKFLLYTINDCLYIVHVLNLNLTSQIVPVYKWLAIQMKNCWEDFSFYTLVNWKLISELVFIKSFFFFLVREIKHLRWTFLQIINTILVTTRYNLTIYGSPSLVPGPLGGLVLRLNGSNQYMQYPPDDGCLWNVEKCKIGLAMSFHLKLLEITNGKQDIFLF